jgi:hypothetical protein
MSCADNLSISCNSPPNARQSNSKDRGRDSAAWLLGASMMAAFAAQPGCVVTDVQFQAPPSSHAEGVCMCSLCWTEPFCFDATRPEGEQVYMPPCDLAEHTAVEADRVDGVARVGGFYCLRPADDKPGARRSTTAFRGRGGRKLPSARSRGSVGSAVSIASTPPATAPRPRTSGSCVGALAPRCGIPLST